MTTRGFWKRASKPLLIAATVLSGGLFQLSDGCSAVQVASPNARGAASPVSVQQLAQAPLRFELNQGQAASSVDFVAKGSGYGFFLNAEGAVLALRNPQTPHSFRSPKESIAQAFALPTAQRSAAPTLLKMRVVNANKAAHGRPQEALASRSNYFLGNDAARWVTKVPHYARVQYDNVYEGIDLAYYGNQQALEYDFIVKPGAQPEQIKLAFDGVDRAFVNAAGELVLQTAVGEVRHHQPVLYQEEQGRRVPVAGRYRALGAQEFGFAVDAYDTSKPLVIDPVLVYSTYLGGFDNEYGNGIEADAAGNAYVTGITYSADFPTKFPLQFSKGGIANAFVAKFDASGRLVYSTFLGGSGEDSGFAIATDGQGNAYVGGTTDSSNFPMTSAGAQTTRRGGLEGFVSKLSPNGDTLVFSTFLGGTNNDTVNSLATDATGNVYVTGQTTSTNFPVRSAWQASLKGQSDAYLTKLSADGSSVAYSTYLGGSGLEAAFGITVDSANNPWLTGLVYSADFPTRNPFQAALGGAVDAFITKFNSTGSSLVFSTYLGGTLDEGGYGIGVDTAGNAFVTGFTSSSNFPTKNAVQAQLAGLDDAFALKVDGAGALVFSTYLGGSGQDRAFDLAVDSSGNAYVIGRTESSNFPTKDAVQPRIGTGSASLSSEEPAAPYVARSAVEAMHRDRFTLGATESVTESSAQQQGTPRDGFVTKFGSAGVIIYSTFVGGSDEDKVFAVAVDNRGNVYITGLTASANFPLKNPVQNALRGLADAFILKLADLGDTQKTVSAASYEGVTLAPDQIVSSFGSGLAAGTQVATALPLPTQLLNTEVRVEDSRGTTRLAQLFFISPTQINFSIPTETAEGAARVTVWNNGAIVSTENVQVAKVSPGLFSANASGKDVLAGVLLRVKSDGRQLFEPVARYDVILNRYVPLPIAFGSDQLYLLAFGTGLRYRGGLPTVNANIGGVSTEVTFAGAQGNLVGLDQVNIALPRTLEGRGTVNLNMIVDGKNANVTTMNFQ